MERPENIINFQEFKARKVLTKLGAWLINALHGENPQIVSDTKTFLVLLANGAFDIEITEKGRPLKMRQGAILSVRMDTLNADPTNLEKGRRGILIRSFIDASHSAAINHMRKVSTAQL